MKKKNLYRAVQLFLIIGGLWVTSNLRADDAFTAPKPLDISTPTGETTNPQDTATSPVSNTPESILNPVSTQRINIGALNKAGIYPLSGSLYVDRAVQLLSLQTSSATISSATISGASVNSIKISSAVITGGITVPNGVSSTDAAAFGQLPVVGQLPGTTTNDNASAGKVGEYIESVVSNVTLPTTGNYGDATSINLTAGDWDTYLACYFSGGTGYTVWITGISQTSGNSNSGLVVGSNFAVIDNLVSKASSQQFLTIGSYRQSLNSTTTIYGKIRNDYTGGSPVAYCRLSARRMR